MGQIAEVGLQDMYGTAGLGEFGFGFGDRVSPGEVVHDQVAEVAGDGSSDGSSDSAGRTGDDGDGLSWIRGTCHHGEQSEKRGVSARPQETAMEIGSLEKTVLAFRGYNITNLGRTAALLQDGRYEPIVAETLREAGKVCAEVTGRRVRLLDRVRRGQETSLRSYAQAIALVVGTEIAQLRALEEVHGVDYRKAQAFFGYSLGEITALACAGIVDWREALALPLEQAADCVALAHDVTLAVVFTREKQIDEDDIQRVCLEVNERGEGVIGVSAWLAPNSLLLMGQGKTVDAFTRLAAEKIDVPLRVRPNRHRWPPLHTPIMWQRSVPDRVSHRMHTVHFEPTVPSPPVWSLVTGGPDYTAVNHRALLRRWVDHPQRLWDVVQRVLNSSVERVLHVGPQPNIIPATFRRLADNVRNQLRGSVGMRALAAAARRPWLAALLPEETSLLLAPRLEQFNLEDWLIENGESS